MNEIHIQTDGRVNGADWHWDCTLCHTSSKPVYKASTVGYMVERHRATQRHQKNLRGSATVAKPETDYETGVQVSFLITDPVTVAAINHYKARIAELESKGVAG